MKRTALGLIAALMTCAAQAAEPLPTGVEAMIRAAAETDDFNAVTAAAKRTFPDSAAAIDALAAILTQEREQKRIARMERAGIFDNWSGEGEAGLSRTTGNTRDVRVLLTYELRQEGLQFRHKLGGLADWQRSSGVVTRNRYASNYEINYKLNDRAYVYGLAGWERNTFAGFTQRWSESFGGGYSILKDETFTLDVSAGPSFQQTRDVDGTRANNISARGSVDFGWRVFRRVMFRQGASIYLGNQFNASTSLTSEIIGGLAARLAFDLIRESNPAAGRRAVDTVSRVSLVYGF